MLADTLAQLLQQRIAIDLVRPRLRGYQAKFVLAFAAFAYWGAALLRLPPLCDFGIQRHNADCKLLRSRLTLLVVIARIEPGQPGYFTIARQGGRLSTREQFLQPGRAPSL